MSAPRYLRFRPMLDTLVTEWREEATTLRRWGATVNADAVEACAIQLETRLREYALESLTLEDAARESGYSYSALQKQLATGELPNAGTKGRPRLRRSDLPRKGRPIAVGLADAILAARQGSAA